MQCPQCQAENPPQAKFCMECAAPLALKCSACGAEVPPRAKFCVECAHPVAKSAPAPTAPPAPAVYTPQHLAERIISSRGALEGERKQVTVLFADLKGSMELLADRDPEDARNILDPVLERMMEAVHRYEGTVNQVMGDGIMALFGAPLAHEDHAVRACYAALRMQESVKQYAEEVFRSQGVRVQIRVGLNSGQVVVRSIGSDLRMDYTAVGQTTHLAARLEQTALPGSILLASETLQLAEGYVQVKALGPVPIKGLSEAVEVYELLGAGLARSRIQAAAARGLTRFVGRNAELAVLRQTLDRAGASHGQTVALVGEPGVGKSRLVWEFSHSHRTQAWLVLESRAVSYSKATPYLPVIDLLKSYCGIEARDDARRIRQKVLGKVLDLDRLLEPSLPAILALLDVPVEDAQWEALDPPQRRQRTLDSLKRLLLRESQEQPVLLVFEDLHWIDAETQALLDGLIESLPTARILLLVNYRPEYEHPWHRKTYYRELRLDPLPLEAAEELLGTLLGNAGALERLKRLLVQRTDGNPFFLEESVRTLVETGALVGERGAYQLVRALDAIQVPATVQAVLAARIDRLAPDDKRLLQAAAVVGKDVAFPLLQAIAELPDGGLRQGLARLQAAEFLYETSLFPDLEYTFKHALTHEVAYGSLLQERRCAVHAQIMEAIETLYRDRLAEQVERLAHHAYRGEVWDKAIVYLRQAGAKAAGRSAHREAVTYLEQALAALQRLPESRDGHQLAIDVRLDLRGSLTPLAEIRRAHAYLDEAEVLARRLGDEGRLCTVASFRSASAFTSGDYDGVFESAQPALVSAEALGDLPTQIRLRFDLGRAHVARGEFQRAIDCLSRAVALLEGQLAYERYWLVVLPSVSIRTWLIFALAERGEFAAAITLGEQAVRIVEAEVQPVDVLVAYWGIGHAHLEKGDLEIAIPLLERGVEAGRAARLPFWLTWIGADLGKSYGLAGRRDEALPWLKQVIQQAPATGLLALQSLRVRYLAEAYLLEQRWEEARIHAEQALALARDRQERPNEAWALRLLGEVAAHADPPDVEQVESYYGESLALAEELGMRPLLAHCHLRLGTLYHKVGWREQAQVELTTAAEMYRAMGMTFWLEKAGAALATVAD